MRQTQDLLTKSKGEIQKLEQGDKIIFQHGLHLGILLVLPVAVLEHMAYVGDPTEPDAQINKDLDGYINAMQALSRNQDGLVAAGILEDGADGGNISPILDKLFTQ